MLCGFRVKSFCCCNWVTGVGDNDCSGSTAGSEVAA